LCVAGKGERVLRGDNGDCVSEEWRG